jgi:hypothetical protein
MLSSVGFETAEYDFRTPPKPEWTSRFDGFFANAVLLHAQPSTFESAVRNVEMVLKDGCAAAISLKSGQGEEVTL